MRPTRSMTWPEARQLIICVTLISAAIGSFFFVLGAPYVLPFSGLEALAVAGAFYVVMRSGERREIVRFEGHDLIVERGRRELEERVQFNRFWVRVELRAPVNRFHPQRLLIVAQGRSLELGQFLTDDERESFATKLINALKKKR